MRNALGRGLDALIPVVPKPSVITPKEQTSLISISKIRPNRLQPRRHFDPERLSELSASIKEHGLAQPILVSFDKSDNSYELIAGERRLRACELAGLDEVEVIVRHPKSDKERLALALIENIQREDLNAIEEALGFLRLMKEFSINQTELGQIVGKSKAVISNTLRLLELSDEIQKALEFGQISEGHGRALLVVKNPLERKGLFDITRERKLSVRETEDLARKVEAGEGLETPLPSIKPQTPKSADIKALEGALQQVLGTKVDILTKKDPTKGKITIHFYSLTDFDKILNMFKK